MHNPLRILHLEDDPLDRELVEAKLSEGGVSYKIRQVDTKESFLRAIEEEEIDIILADYSLPAFDGLTALEIAKQKRPLVPFIFVSGTMGEDLAIETLKSGATDYVLKQKLSRLVPALRRALEEAESKRELAESEKTLRDVLNRLKLQIRFMPLACIVWDPQHRIREWNPAAETIFGWPEEEACGKAVLDLIVPPEEHESRTILLGKILNEDVGARIISINRTKSGKKITCEWFRTYLKDEAGNFVGVLSMVNDITSRIELEKQLLVAQRMEAVGTLAGGVAHDFNNILTGILGFSEFLRVHLEGNMKALEDLDQIRQAAERASNLTRQMLTFARRQVVDPVHLDLNVVVSDLMKLVGKLVGEQIEVKSVLADGVPTIHADRGQIEQVLMNLCINSRDAMPTGGQLLIESGKEVLDQEYCNRHLFTRPGSYTVLSVTDTGVGMDEEVRRRAFEPFFTTKAPDKGTGLGLSVVYGIVKKHDGFVTLYSEPGKGTTFKIYLPAVEGVAEEAAQGAQAPIPRGTETVLVAEDEAPIRWLIGRILTELGYKVLITSDGKEAVDVARKRRGIDIAVLDLVMPKMSGKEVYEAMKKEHPGLKAIFMSGYSANAIHDSFVLHPGVPFLQKPFGPGVLARKVREVLDGE
jgi:PAS domain S-box